MEPATLSQPAQRWNVQPAMLAAASRMVCTPPLPLYGTVWLPQSLTSRSLAGGDCEHVQKVARFIQPPAPWIDPLMVSEAADAGPARSRPSTSVSMRMRMATPPS